MSVKSQMPFEPVYCISLFGETKGSSTVIYFFTFNEEYVSRGDSRISMQVRFLILINQNSSLIKILSHAGEKFLVIHLFGIQAVKCKKATINKVIYIGSENSRLTQYF